MKVLALGDTHGRSDWKQITANEKFDKIVFSGDYFDTHDNISVKVQRDNFSDIIKYKRDNMDKVVLLIGNHDYHYMKGVNESYSGFQYKHKLSIQYLLDNALDDDLLQVCYVYDNYIFSHAGVTKTWLVDTGYNGESIESYINNLFKYKSSYFNFMMGDNLSNTGDDICQSPLWVRPHSLLEDCIDNYIQVVGHTIVYHLSVIRDKIILIDTLNTSKEFLCIDDGKISILSSEY